ncbi:MAG: type I-F CRISPR-associated protein Csy1 [Thiotrichales bacterium]
MLDPAIQDFLSERKELWLKKKIKSNTSEDEASRFQQEANDVFALSSWLPDAAKRARQLSLVSHPAKFTHPGAKTSSLIADATRQADGFLRTGNVEVELDVFGNAAAMDVYKFLMLTLKDEKTILQHLEEDSEAIQHQFTMDTATLDELKTGLLAIKQNDSTKAVTSGSVKQVYFPVDDDYHLLSVLTPSSVMFKLRGRINEIRFSEDAKAAREAKRANKSHDDYHEVYDLTAIGFGGTKPQNISVMNSQNGGVAYLLSSMPPKLDSRRTNPPRDNFFGKYLNPKRYADEFEKLQTELNRDWNNIHIRNKIKWQIKQIFFLLIDRSWEVRYLPAGWSASDHYHALPQSQKIWLDQQYQEQREQDQAWLEDVKHSATRWFIASYKKLLGDQAQPLTDIEFLNIRDLLDECEGGLR